MLKIKRLQSDQADFQQQLEALLAWDAVSDKSVVSIVDEILAAVKQGGDAALVEYTNRFDGRNVKSIAES